MRKNVDRGQARRGRRDGSRAACSPRKDQERRPVRSGTRRGTACRSESRPSRARARRNAGCVLSNSPGATEAESLDDRSSSRARDRPIPRRAPGPAWPLPVEAPPRRGPAWRRRPSGAAASQLRSVISCGTRRSQIASHCCGEQSVDGSSASRRRRLSHSACAKPLRCSARPSGTAPAPRPERGTAGSTGQLSAFAWSQRTSSASQWRAVGVRGVLLVRRAVRDVRAAGDQRRPARSRPARRSRASASASWSCPSTLAVCQP